MLTDGWTDKLTGGWFENWNAYETLLGGWPFHCPPNINRLVSLFPENRKLFSYVPCSPILPLYPVSLKIWPLFPVTLKNRLAGPKGERSVRFKKCLKKTLRSMDLEALRQTISVTFLHAKNRQFIRNMLAITFSLYLNLSFVFHQCKI